MKTRIEYHGKVDKDGRCSFSLHWMDNYFSGHPEGRMCVGSEVSTSSTIQGRMVTHFLRKNSP